MPTRSPPHPETTSPGSHNPWLMKTQLSHADFPSDAENRKRSASRTHALRCHPNALAKNNSVPRNYITQAKLYSIANKICGSGGFGLEVRHMTLSGVRSH